MNLNNARRMLNELSVRDTEMVSTWSGNPLENIVSMLLGKVTTLLSAVLMRRLFILEICLPEI